MQLLQLSFKLSEPLQQLFMPSTTLPQLLCRLSELLLKQSTASITQLPWLPRQPELFQPSLFMFMMMGFSVLLSPQSTLW